MVSQGNNPMIADSHAFGSRARSEFPLVAHRDETVDRLVPVARER
jgi:hypothetical protein